MANIFEKEQRMWVGIIQKNLMKKLTARAEDYFVCFDLFTVTADKSNISKVFVIYQVPECVFWSYSKLIPG